MMIFELQNIESLSLPPESVVEPKENKGALYQITVRLPSWGLRAVYRLLPISWEDTTMFRKWLNRVEQSEQDTVSGTTDIELPVPPLLVTVSKLLFHLCNVAAGWWPWKEVCDWPNLGHLPSTHWY